MRTACEVCGEHKLCDEEDVCHDCRQDESDLEDWLPEDEDDMMGEAEKNDYSY